MNSRSVAVTRRAVANNLGAILFSKDSGCVNAMLLFQESVQPLMYVEGESQGETPSNERQAIMSASSFISFLPTSESRQALGS